MKTSIHLRSRSRALPYQVFILTLLLFSMAITTLKASNEYVTPQKDASGESKEISSSRFKASTEVNRDGVLPMEAWMLNVSDKLWVVNFEEPLRIENWMMRIHNTNWGLESEEDPILTLQFWMLHPAEWAQKQLTGEMRWCNY